MNALGLILLLTTQVSPDNGLVTVSGLGLQIVPTSLSASIEKGQRSFKLRAEYRLVRRAKFFEIVPSCNEIAFRWKEQRAETALRLDPATKQTELVLFESDGAVTESKESTSLTKILHCTTLFKFGSVKSFGMLWLVLKVEDPAATRDAIGKIPGFRKLKNSKKYPYESSSDYYSNSAGLSLELVNQTQTDPDGIRPKGWSLTILL